MLSKVKQCGLLEKGKYICIILVRFSFQIRMKLLKQGLLGMYIYNEVYQCR